MAIHAANLAAARRWFEEIWGEGKTEAVHELLLPHSVCHTDAGDMVGPGPFLEFHARLRETLPGMAVSVEQTLSEGDTVAVRWRLEFERGGDRYRFQGVTWMRFRDGKLVEGWDCWNAAGLARILAESGG